LLLALGFLDCVWAWSLLQTNGFIVSYTYAHGINDSIGLSVWSTVMGWAAGIGFHLVALNRVVQRHQKPEAVLLIISALWLTWLCASVWAVSVFGTLVGDILHAAFSH
jgi:hypothetical protein